MGKENQIYVRQVVKINRRICAACPGHTWSEMYVISCAQKVGLAVVSSSCCHSSRNLVQGTSVTKRSPSHSLACIFLVFGSAPKCACKIVVAVPTKQACILSARLRGVNIDRFRQGKMFGKSFVGREVSGWSLLRFRVNRQRLHLAAHTLGSPMSRIFRRISRQKTSCNPSN